LFVSISQVIGCEDRLRNDLYCVEWGVKLYSIHPSTAKNRDQLGNPTLGNRVWATFTFFKVKCKDIIVRSLTCYTATGTHMPYIRSRIVSYLPPGRGDIPLLPQPKLVLN